MNTAFRRVIRTISIVALASACAHAASAPVAGECIVPSKPGGGFDLTCKLSQKGLQLMQPKSPPLRLSYIPGGIGAVAWSAVTTQRTAEPDTLIAFSGGSVLNMSLGKFGNASPSDVRWVAGIGTDYGMIAVRKDAPYRNLRELVDTLKRNPGKAVIGAGGTIGSQDWLKVASVVKQHGGDPKRLNFVAFEGGGESFTALMAGLVDVVSGDASEASLYVGSGKVRVLAVLADKRLPGALADVPTAREQGFDITWPIIRGVYMGPKVRDADYRKWVQTFDHMMATPEFDQLRAEYGLYPFAMTGDTFTAYIKKTADDYSRQAKELGLIR